MLKAITVAIAVAILIAGCTQQKSATAGVADAMGAANLNSIEYSGSGELFGFGQAYVPGERWPRFIQRSYNIAINYQTPAMRMNTIRSQGEYPPRGGAAQPVGADQRTIQVVSGKYAWTEGGAQPNPNPNAVGDRLRQLWTTPHGVVKAAMSNGGKLEGNVITFKVDDREVKATLSDQNLVQKVSFSSTNEVVGDFADEITYSDYADFNGVKFPTHIVETQAGFPILDLRIDEVKPHVGVTLNMPRNVAPTPLPPAQPPVFETVRDKKVITDGTRTMELYHLQNSGHNVATLIVYLPKEGLLYYGDGYNPPPGDNPIDPARTPEYGIDLYRNITLLNLNVKTIAPAHSTRAVPFDNLKKAIGVLPVASH